MEISRCIAFLRPGENFIVENNDISKAYMNDGSDPPTFVECEAVWSTVAAEILAEQNAMKISELEAEMAKGFFWLLKKLIQADVIQVADIPQKIKDIYNARDAL